jgi:hypothetical protein
MLGRPSLLRSSVLKEAAMLSFCMVERASLHSDGQHEGLVFRIGHDQSELQMCSEQILTNPDLGLTLTALVTGSWGTGSPAPGFWLGMEKFTCASHSHSPVGRPALCLDILPGVVVCHDHASCFGHHAQTPCASSFTVLGSFPPPFSLPPHMNGGRFTSRGHPEVMTQSATM